METVELVGGHHVEELLDFLLSVEMAAFVEHEAAPPETRCVGDAHGGQCPLRGGGAAGLGSRHHGARGQQLLQGLEGIEETGGTGGFDDHLAGVDIKAVAFGSQRGIELEVQGGFRGFRFDELQAGGFAELAGKAVEHPPDAVAGIGIGGDFRFVLELELAQPGLHLRRQRNDGRSGLRTHRQEAGGQHPGQQGS